MQGSCGFWWRSSSSLEKHSGRFHAWSAGEKKKRLRCFRKLPFLHLSHSLPVRNRVCCLAALTAGLHPCAKMISSLPPQSAVVHGHNMQHPTPMSAGKLRQREGCELRSCKDALGALGEAPSLREIGRLTASVSDSGNTTRERRGFREAGVHSPYNANS